MTQLTVERDAGAIADMRPADGLVTPAARAERIASIDVLRGVAVLGILLMNIQGFALPPGAHDNPTIAGGSSSAEVWVWAVNSVLFEGKMRTIFSMLFGASVLLLIGRIDARVGREQAADIHLRRNLWLVLFGIVHGYLLLWWGDILYAYGLIGMALFAFRRMTPRALMICGTVILAIQVPKNLSFERDLWTAVSGVAAVEQATAAGQPLTEEQKASIEGWREVLARQRPTAETTQKDIDARRQGYLANVATLAPRNANIESTIFYQFLFFDIAGMMFFGMALFKLGVSSAARSYRFYATMVFAGYAIGVPLGTWVTYDWVVRHGFDVGTQVWVFYDVERMAVALGHIGVVMLVCKAGVLTWLTRRLAAVGQMALTNYILQTLICGLVFFGYGLALFGQLPRHQLYYVVAAVWMFQLIASPIWLRRFRFGPLEWLWRSLTYQARQPMRAASPAQAA
jgi:uncharacterized protein